MIFRISFKFYFIYLITIIISQNNVDDYRDIFDKTFNYVNEGYVDSINHSELLISGIKGMLKPLDPYTKLVVGSSKENLDMLTKGRYGGVGIRISSLRDTLTVLSPMEDSPAYTEGIKAGDQIIRIDSVDALGMSTKDASKIIKGKLGSEVTLHIRRPSSKKRYSFELTRSNIAVKHVPYWSIDENSIGYIRVTRFSRNTYKDFSKALRELDGEEFVDSNSNSKWDKGENYRDSNDNNQWDPGERFVDSNSNNKWDAPEEFTDSNNNGKFDQSGRLKGLIIDLRGNSGGLLSQSIAILNSLIDKGESLLYTKGRGGKVLREYKSSSKPIISNSVPIIVMVNKGSASASEIVSGVIQDLDRGVVIGRTTFGKGLVQQVKNLNDTISLKVTNAKYYIPSGRLIQKEDWLDNGYLTDGLNSNDSLFYTINMRRPMKGGGGIQPDIKTEIEKAPAFINALWKKGVFLSFAAQYKISKDMDNSDIEITDKIFNEFEDFYNDIKGDVTYKLPGEKDFDNMKLKIQNQSDNADFLSIFQRRNNAQRYLDRMEKYFKIEKSRQFQNEVNKKWLINGLEKEFSRVLISEKERIGVSLKVDNEYDEAIAILLNKDLYNSILGY